jgi:putative transposase
LPRKPRIDVGEEIYHVINRADGRRRVFRSHKDYRRFSEVLAQAVERFQMRLLAYCIMPTHWHLVVWPRKDGDLALFMQWLTVTHTRRYHVRKGTVGTGHIYQGRYKAHLVQSDHHFLAVCRYVEGNPVAGHLVPRARDWPWGSLARRIGGWSDGGRPTLCAWPNEIPSDWEEQVDERVCARDCQALRLSIKTGMPFGSPDWTQDRLKQLGLTFPARRPGRPHLEDRT